MQATKPETNWRDVATRTAWTAVAVGGAAALDAIADLPGWWVPVATSALTAFLVVARQRAGTLPTRV